jgi:hypothetical protein
VRECTVGTWVWATVGRVGGEVLKSYRRERALPLPLLQPHERSRTPPPPCAPRGGRSRDRRAPPLYAPRLRRFRRSPSAATPPPSRRSCRSRRPSCTSAGPRARCRAQYGWRGTVGRRVWGRVGGGGGERPPARRGARRRPRAARAARRLSRETLIWSRETPSGPRRQGARRGRSSQ